MRQLDVRIGDGCKCENNPEGIRVFDDETGEDVTNRCAFINFIPARGFEWPMFLRDQGGKLYIDPKTGEVAVEFGLVARVTPGRLRRWIHALLRLFHMKGGEVA